MSTDQNQAGSLQEMQKQQRLGRKKAQTSQKKKSSGSKQICIHLRTLRLKLFF